MNVNSLYRLASLLDTEGRYLEADVILDSMMRFAKGAEKYYGNRARRPKVPFKAMPGARPAVPVTPVTPAPRSSYNPDPFGNYSIRDTLGYTDPGPVQRQPANTQFRRVSPGQTQLYPMGLQDPSLPRPQGYAQPTTPKTQAPKVAPKNYNQINNEIRMRVFQNPKLNPQLAATLELERSLGRFDPKTGELAESALETLGRAYEKAGPTVVQQGGRGGQIGAKAAQLAAKAKNSPAASSVVNALEKMSGTLKFIRPIAKLMPFIGFALAIPDFVRLCNRINQDGWEAIWNDAYDRAKAIGVIANTVAAAVSIAPGPLTPVAAALSAIGMGSDLGADVARDAGDAVEGGEFKLFGKTLKQKSKQRQQQDAFEAGINAKNIDPQVQLALSASKNMIMSGSKILDIMNDPTMKQSYPWLGTGDAKDVQFRVQITALRKSLRSGGGQDQTAQPQQLGKSQEQAQGPYLNKPPYSGPTNQQGQAVYNNAQQPQQQMSQLKNHNDLLYKAYVDTVQTTNVTLENLQNYRQQIIGKIQALSQYYPNINAQQAITALDNRIRKYSGQAQPA